MLAPERSNARVDRLLVGECETRGGRDPVRRCASGQQHQQQIVHTRLVRQHQRLLGGIDTCLVRHRMAGFNHRNVLRWLGIAVARNGKPKQPIFWKTALQVVLLGDCGH